MKPLAIDLYAGLGGWTEGLLAAGYEVVGFDIERHEYGEHCYPAQLVLQDVLTLHGKQFKDAALIVASPPCQEYSYMAMPWSRAKAIAAEYRSGARDVKKLTALFDACFRIQREAIEAQDCTCGHPESDHEHDYLSGDDVCSKCSCIYLEKRHIPLVVENVRGAQPWVGRSRWNFGSFHLWGDVPALMPMVKGRKNNGGSWFKIGSPGQKETNRNPVQGRRTALGSGERFTSRHGQARKAASAMIAKIPFELARHCAMAWKP